MSRSHYSIGSDVEIEMPILTVPGRTPRGGGSSSSSGSGSGSSPVRTGSGGSTSPTRQPRTGGTVVGREIEKDSPIIPVLYPGPSTDKESKKEPSSPNRTPRKESGSTRSGSGSGAGGGSTISNDPGIGNGSPVTPVLYPGPGIDPEEQPVSTTQTPDILSQMPNFPDINIKNLPPWAIPAGLAALALIIASR